MALGIVAIAAATTIAQIYQSEQARGASKKHLKQLREEFDKLIPPEYDLSPMDPPQYIMQAIPEPSYDMSDITPEQFELVGKYQPEIAAYVAEQNPQLVQETAAAREGREAQMSALRRLRQVADSDSDPILAQAMDEAAKSSQIEAQSRSQSILQDAARRGALDSGTMLAAQLQGASDSMESAASHSRDAAAEAYRNRLAALRDSAELGGRVRGQDLDLEARNADIINQFNQRTTRARQDWANQRANTLNDAQLRNLAEQQRIADANVSSRNDAAWRNRGRQDELLSKLYAIRASERDNRNNLIGKTADWRAAERDRADKLKDTMYGYQVDKMKSKMGLASTAMDMNMQGARDRNSAIQGLGNAAMSGYMYGQQMDQYDRGNAAADDRAFFDRHGRWMTEEEKRKRYGGM